MKRHPHNILKPNCDAGPDEWRIVDFKCNYSAFNGYNHTPSDYSLVRCTKCDHHWRTKAAYVGSLKFDQYLNVRQYRETIK